MPLEDACRLDDLDLPVGRVLPGLAGTPAAAHTLRHLLTMTRGCETEGPFEIDVFATGWAGQLAAVPAARAVVVVTGDLCFDPGPPPTDQLQPGWRPAGELVRAHLLPALGELA